MSAYQLDNNGNLILLAGDTIVGEKSLTIPTTGWVAQTNGQYNYKISVSATGITENDVLNGRITLATESIAQNCNLSNLCESGNGTVTFYAGSVPSGEMVFKYNILLGKGAVI